MHQRYRFLYIFIMAAAACLMFGQYALAQYFYNSLGFNANVDLSYEYDYFKTTNGSSSTSQRNIFTTGLDITHRAYLFHPSLASLRAGVNISPFYEIISSTGSDSTNNGFLLGYGLNADFLNNKPYNFRLFANRLEAITSREFAGRLETKFQNVGGEFHLKHNIIDSVFLVSRQSTREDQEGFQLRGDDRNILEYIGRKEWENSEIRLNYKYEDVEYIDVPDIDFKSNRASLLHRAFFGPNLNWALSSRVSYFDVDSFSPTTDFRVDENLSIDHTENFSTGYSYSYNEFENVNNKSTIQSANINARYNLYDSLTATTGARGRDSSLETGMVRIYGGYGGLSYRKKIPFGGMFRVGGNADYQIDDRDLDEGAIFVSGESHIVPAERTFFLDNPQPIPESIVVFNQDRTTIFIEGVDYELNIIDNLVEIRVLITGIINEGDTLIIDYEFISSSAGKIHSVGWSTSTGLDFRRFSVSYDHRENTQDVTEGFIDDQFLNEFVIDVFRLEIRFNGETYKVVFKNEYEMNDSTNFTYDRLAFNQLFSYKLGRESRLNINLLESYTDFEDPAKTQKLFLANANINKRLYSSLFLFPYASVRIQRDTSARDENLYEGGVRLRWRYGKLQVSSNASYSLRDIDVSTTQEVNFFISITRSFN